MERTINDKEYNFEITVHELKLSDYCGYYGSEFLVYCTIACNKKEAETWVTIKYPAGNAYDYYSDCEISDLVEWYPEEAAEIENDFGAWYEKHEDALVKDFIDMIIDCMWNEEDYVQECILDALIENKYNRYSDEFHPLLVSEDDVIRSISLEEDFVYVPEFLCDDFSDEEFDDAPDYLRCYPCSKWGNCAGESIFKLIVNEYERYDITLYISKYLAANYEVGTGWSNIFEYGSYCIRLMFEHEGIHRIGELKKYLSLHNNTIQLEDYEA